MSIIKQYHKDTGITYVYESESYWDKEKKQPRSRRKLIGKLDDETGEIIPTGKKNAPKKEDNMKIDASVRENTMLRQKLKQLEKELTSEKERTCKAEAENQILRNKLDKIREILNLV